MRKISVTFLVLFAFCLTELALAQANFGTSLHATRNGKTTWYNSENGGFESLSNVPIEGLGCVECHDATDANGTPYPVNYTPGCADCHASNLAVTQDDCLGCHSREKSIITKGIPDVHRSATTPFTCMDCHKKEELHGDDGIAHQSMFDPGAIQTDCSNSGCHAGFNHSNPGVDPHGGKIHCTSCHASTNLTCLSCHLESQVVGKKRAVGQYVNFMILVNRDKDNKVHPASFQSLTHDGNTWIGMGPSVAHTITRTGARTCSACHANYGGSIPAITEYNSGTGIKFAKWNQNDSTYSVLSGIVPLPADYQYSFKMDFVKYNGDPNDAVVSTKNWSVVKDNVDGFALRYASPLTTVQMAKIGMDTLQIVVPVELSSFAAEVKGLNVVLNWTTETEMNNNGFEVQKKVAGKFIPVGFIKGNGTTTEQHKYSFTDKLTQPGKYIYRLKQIDLDGTSEYSKEIEVSVLQGLNYSLNQNYPNPFNPVTRITYSIPQSGFVELNVYDALGNLVKALVSENKDAGYFDIQFDGSNLSSGIYYYQLKAGNFSETRKLVLMK